MRCFNAGTMPPSVPSASHASSIRWACEEVGIYFPLTPIYVKSRVLATLCFLYLVSAMTRQAGKCYPHFVARPLRCRAVK